MDRWGDDNELYYLSFADGVRSVTHIALTMATAQVRGERNRNSGDDKGHRKEKTKIYRSKWEREEKNERKGTRWWFMTECRHHLTTHVSVSFTVSRLQIFFFHFFASEVSFISLFLSSISQIYHAVMVEMVGNRQFGHMAWILLSLDISDRFIIASIVKVQPGRTEGIELWFQGSL